MAKFRVTLFFNGSSFPFLRDKSEGLVVPAEPMTEDETPLMARSGSAAAVDLNTTYATPNLMVFPRDPPPKYVHFTSSTSP